MISRCEHPEICPLRPLARKSGEGLADGFTLIELLVTLALLGLAWTIIAGYKPPWSRTAGLQATAAELAAGLRLARSEAILSNRPVVFEVDPVDRRYRIGTGPPRPLPASFSVELLTISGEVRDARDGDIRFNPDGSSTGGRISLIDGQRRVAVGVDWLTGRVGIAHAR
jgi:general secretion pathway protein H